MIPSGHNAWKDSERIRTWFEVVFDMTETPPRHTAYVCKCCWEQMPASEDLIGLMAHAEWHESHGESPYSSRRASPITGEQIYDLYGQINLLFEAMMPEAGTWKFQCRKCKKRLPHRSTHKDLMLHARVCIGTGPSEGKAN